MIPERLIDLTTIIAKQNKRHTIYTHLGCVLIRLILGLLIYYKISIFKSYKFLTFLYIIIIIIFGNRLIITKNKTWKVFIRTIIFYSLSLIINSIDYHKYQIYNKQTRNISGLFIIFDAILGMQSRHIQNNFNS